MSSAAVLAGLALALSTSSAAAQDAASCQVALADLTVNDEPPPESYRDLLATAIRPTIDPILQCYRDRVVQRGPVQGQLRLRLWVSARQVIRVTREQSTLGDAELEQCAIERIREFRLPDSAPEGGARVRFVLRFWMTGTPPVPAPPPSDTPPRDVDASPPAAGAAQPPPIVPFVTTVVPGAPSWELARARIRLDAVRGALDATTIAAAIPTSIFDACPPGVGEMQVRLSIGRDGSLRARHGSGSVRDRALVRCIVDAIRARTMPAASGNTRAVLTIVLRR